MNYIQRYKIIILFTIEQQPLISMSTAINKSVLSEGSIIPNSLVSPKSNPATSPTEQIQQHHATSLKQSVLQSYIHEQYSHINYEPKLKIFFYEFIGMILFVVIALSVKTAKFADVNVGLGVLVGVVMCGPVSGANLNPAVTFCNCFKKQNKFKWNMLPVYYLAQFLGALVAIIYCQLIDDFKAEALEPLTKDVVGCFRVVGSQAFGSFILIFFILLISNPNTTFIDNQLSGYMFIVVFVHTARKYAPSSHQCINTIIALSFAFVNAIQTGDGLGLLYCLLWLSGDFVGTIIAILFYEKLFEPNVQEMRKKKREFQDKNIQSILAMTEQMEHSAIVMRIQKIDQMQID